MADLCYFVYMPGMEIKGLMFRIDNKTKIKNPYFLSLAFIQALKAPIFLPLKALAAALNFDFCPLFPMPLFIIKLNKSC